MSTEENRYRLNSDQIQKFLPHRYPFLLIDRVLEIHPQGDVKDPAPSSSKVGTRVVALKNVSVNEACFQGHFPGKSVFPGVLLLEAMAQAASMSVYPYLEANLERMARDFQCILLGFDHTRFRLPVVPGDTVRLEALLTGCRGKLWTFDCTASVDGRMVAEAKILADLMLRS